MRRIMIDEKLLTLIKDIAGDCNVRLDEPMKKHTTFRIGGAADCFVTPETTEQIKQLILLLRENAVPYYVIGNGSNLLVSDEGFRGVIIQIYDKFNKHEFVHDDTLSAADKSNIVKIKVQAGMNMGRLGNIAQQNSLTGFEFASGIPGTIGGGVVMNAGAYGGELKDILVSATVMDIDGNISILNNDELELGYRTSIIQKKSLIVLEAVIALRTGDKDKIRERMSELAAARRDKQPLEFPSAGSTFKRPEGHFAGKLVQDAGFKGFAVGGAKVADKHAGFVVNTCNATAHDVIKLTDMISDKVFEMFGVRLELEVKKLGF